jgi:ATP-dependent exoDNAse (exonuclease V) alpha subunit
MTSKIQLTSDQQKAVDAFFTFLTTDADTFVLSGGAGVGKTFLMEYISNDLLLTYERSCALLGVKPIDYTVHYTATTNKAAEVLENAVRREVPTIHSFLGLKVQDNWKTGKSELIETNNSKHHRDIILFIDESSMIDTKLYKQILKRVTNSKIVFVGDKSQLAPVGEVLSPVYQNVDPNYFIHMSQPVRNSGSPALMNLCDQLRHTVENQVFHRLPLTPGSVELLNDSQMEKKLKEYFLTPNETARILCYTNTRVNAFNDHIRHIRNLPPEFVAGDQVVVARAFVRGNLTLNVERELTIVDIEPEIHELGFENYSPDGKPVLYRNLLLRPKATFMDPLQIPVPLDPEHATETMKKASKRRDWGSYFQLKNELADLRGKEACTVYKSQGSTYDTVFVDIGNIGISDDPEQVARMLFVGASRARSKVYLYGELPSKYQGRTDYAHPAKKLLIV